MEVLYLFGFVMAFLTPIVLATVVIMWACNKWS